MRTRWRDLPDGLQDTIAGVAFAIAWFGAYRYWRDHDWRPQYPEAFELAGAWSAVAIALRRAAPLPLLAVTALLYPLFYDAPLQTEFHLLPVLIAGFAATSDPRTGRLWSAGAGVAAMFSVLALSNRAEGFFGRVDWARVLFDEFATVAVLVLGFVLHEQRRTAADLAARNAELERLRRVEAEQAIVEERTRIARELHDVVAHHLTAVIIRAQAADRVAASQPEAAGDAVRYIATTARDALTAMRQTVKVLRSEPALTPGPSLADLPRIVARVSDAGLPVSLQVADPLPPLDRRAELAAVRIAQEALTNALRHAGAARAVVSLRAADDGVVLDVEDDGRGGEVGETKGHGLIGMRERATSCGGRLSIDKSALGGWRVRAWLPV